MLSPSGRSSLLQGVPPIYLVQDLQSEASVPWVRRAEMRMPVEYTKPNGFRLIGLFLANSKGLNLEKIVIRSLLNLAHL
jgi:hypothetical protein